MFLFQKIMIASSALLKLFIYKTEYVLPYYVDDLESNNSCKRCLDGDIDSVFFI